MSNLEGKTLRERYFLRQLIGKGGMADVYLAWDKTRSTKMAVKVLRQESRGKARRFQTFSKEAELLRKLEHPFIVRLYEFDRQGEIVFLVMDWVEGTNLRQAIEERGGPFSFEEISNILKPVCSALNYAHQNHIFHCDIKPANILLHTDGRVLLSDFGVARLAEEAKGGGTPAYMAPEQILEQEVSAATDVYALGITLYEMLSGGILPFRGDSPNSKGSTLQERIEWEHCHLDVPPLKEFNPHIQESMIQVITKALNKDVHLRYPTTLALQEDFEQARASVPGEIKSKETIFHTIVRELPKPAPGPIIQPPADRPATPLGRHLFGRGGEWAGRTFQISDQAVSIGRGDHNQLRLQERSVSRTHATLLRTRRGVYIRDENSLLGTYVNDRRIGGPVRLRQGDLIRIGVYQVFEYRER
jgi:serine/threonine protein kinase